MIAASGELTKGIRMRNRIHESTLIRSRWAAIGAAVAVSIGAGGLAFVNAAVSSDAAVFHALSPVRVFDTRLGTGGVPIAPIAANSTLEVVVGGTNGVPLDATAVVLNVTVVNGTASSFLTAWPTGEPRPTASSLNWTTSAATPNGVTVPLGTGGKVSFYNLTGTVDVLADVAGYYTAADAPPFVPVVAQTTSGPGIPATTGQLSSVTLTLPDSCPGAADQWRVLVQADGYYLTQANPAGTATVGLSVDGTNYQAGSITTQNFAFTGQWRESFSTAYLFTVDSGTHTFYALGESNVNVSAAQLNIIAQSASVTC